jgi:hypothetical protein
MLSGIKTTQYTIKTEKKDDKSLAFQLLDGQGSACTTLLTPEVHQHLSALFNGAPKCVERSSGGLSLVTPSQALFVKNKEDQKEIRIRVLFQELERDPQHRIVSNKIVTRTKIVLLSDVIESPWADCFNKPGSFCVDFGMGLIPVHVFNFQEDPDGVMWALFVRFDELERALVHEKKSSTELSIYKVPKDLLRYLHSTLGNQIRSFQWAKDHAHKLHSRGEKLVPDLLREGKPCPVRTGLTFDEIINQLKGHLESDLRETNLPIFYLESDSLIPLNENSD